MQDFLIKALFTVLTLAVFIGLFSLYSWYANKSLRRDDKIRAAGHKVWATLVCTHPTGQSAVKNVYRLYAEQYYVLLELDVPQPNGTTFRCTTKGLPPPDWHPLLPGDQVQVYENPDDPTQVVLDTIMSPRYRTTFGKS